MIFVYMNIANMSLFYVVIGMLANAVNYVHCEDYVYV